MNNIKEIHERIRSILIKYECEEFGDVIIGEICEAVGIDTTNIYYNED